MQFLHIDYGGRCTAYLACKHPVFRAYSPSATNLAVPGIHLHVPSHLTFGQKTTLKLKLPDILGVVNGYSQALLQQLEYSWPRLCICDSYHDCTKVFQARLGSR